VPKNKKKSATAKTKPHAIEQKRITTAIMEEKSSCDLMDHVNKRVRDLGTCSNEDDCNEDHPIAFCTEVNHASPSSLARMQDTNPFHRTGASKKRLPCNCHCMGFEAGCMARKFVWKSKDNNNMTIGTGQPLFACFTCKNCVDCEGHCKRVICDSCHELKRPSTKRARKQTHT